MQASGTWVAPRRELDRGRSHAESKPKETIEQVNEEPEELQTMRAMTPEARKILLRKMNEAEAEAAAEAKDSEAATG